MRPRPAARRPARLRPSRGLARVLARVVALAALLAPAARAAEAAGAAAGAAEDCFDRLAATRASSLGEPRRAEPAPDGRSVLYLRSGPRDTRQRLYRLDLASGAETELAAPDAGPEVLSAAEKARRERARMTLAGITDIAVSRDGATALLTQADRLVRVGAATGEAAPVPGAGWIAPRLSPDGRRVAVVRDNDLHVVTLDTGEDVQVTQGGGETLSHGLAEFAAAEELDRADGAWWSPDGATLLYEESDTSGVEPHFIADPEHPATPPAAFRYPRAGTANARVRLGLVSRGGVSGSKVSDSGAAGSGAAGEWGGTRWVDWDGEAWPYLARVSWTEGHLCLVVLNRAQTEERVLSVDPQSGHATTLLSESDPAWLDLDPLPRQEGRALPLWLPDGSGFLWAAERDGDWRLELRRADASLERVLAPGLSFLAVADLDAAGGTATVAALTPDRLGTTVQRVSLATGEAAPVAAEPGLHEARFAQGGAEDGHGVFVDRFRGADGTQADLVRAADGRVIATLPSRAEAPAALPAPEFTTAGPLSLDAVILRPASAASAAPGTRYPVVLSVYAGPTVKMVERAPRRYLDDQCLADQASWWSAWTGAARPGEAATGSAPRAATSSTCRSTTRSRGCGRWARATRRWTSRGWASPAGRSGGISRRWPRSAGRTCSRPASRARRSLTSRTTTPPTRSATWARPGPTRAATARRAC